MRVCDACYLGGGEPTNIIHGSKTHKSTAFPSGNNEEMWNKHNQPEFCNDCFELFKTKNWSELGKRQEQSLRMILNPVKPRRRASDTPKEKVSPSPEEE